ncbi:MAG: CBS domain-containing protein [Candidatus Methanomethylicia archaeon]
MVIYMNEGMRVISILLEDLKGLFAKDYMTPIRDVIDAETPIWKLIEIASYTPGRKTFFVAKDGKPIGMISIYKLFKWILLKTRELKDLMGEIEVEVREALGVRAMDFADKLVTVPEDATIVDAMREMVRYNVDVIGIVSSDGEVIGELECRMILELALKLISKS